MQNSALAGELDKRFGWFTPLRALQAEYQPFSHDWNKAIVEKYLETLELAYRVAGTLKSRQFGRARFLGIYQPFRIPANFQKVHSHVRRRLAETAYAIDLSNEYNDIVPSPYEDGVHLKQAARDRMGKRLAALIAARLDAWRVGTE